MNDKDRGRPVAAGWLIALTAPLALCPMLAFIVSGQNEVIFGDFSYVSTSMADYLLGGIQSFVGGMLTALAIRQNGWISSRWWWAYSIVFGLAPGALLFPIVGGAGLNIGFYFLIATLVASVLLRRLIIALGWMRSPGQRCP